MADDTVELVPTITFSLGLPSKKAVEIVRMRSHSVDEKWDESKNICDETLIQ